MNSLRLLFGYAIVALFCASCAARYHLIQPTGLSFDTPPDTLAGANVEVAWRSNIFEETRNRKYARMEKRQHVSLLAMRLHNFGTDTLYFPEDVLIVAGEDTLPPLYLEETIALFERHQREKEFYTIDDFLFYLFFAAVPDAVNASIKRKANEKMAGEMEDFYLVYSTIPPGAKVAGLLVLPVERGTRVRFLWRQKP